MKIVIDIDEKDYRDFQLQAVMLNPAEPSQRAKLAIANGTPLPKGHGALKDADKLAIAIAMMRDRGNYYGNEYEQALFQAYDICVDEITDAPTIIEADKVCTYKETGCGSCRWQIECPCDEADKEGAEE